MRILYVINSLGHGGAEKHLLSLVKYMVSAGHQVLVVSLTHLDAGGARVITKDLKSFGAEIRVLGDSASYWLGDIRRWFNLWAVVGSWAPDVIHSHLPRSDFATSIVKRFRRKLVWISTIHDAYVKGVYSGYWVFPWLRWNWQIIDHVITVSGHAERWATEALKIPLNKIKTIYHGVTIPSGNTKNHGSNGNMVTLNIGCLSRYEPRKGLDILIEAMVIVCERYPSARLTIAGSDPRGYAKELKRRADALGVRNNVDIQGFCERPLEFLSNLDIFAFASISEGFGIVLIEAMSVGVPIVASDLYPLNYIVSHGDTGILAEPNNPRSFANALIALLGDAELRSSMGKAGLKRCVEEFPEDKMLLETERIYSTLHS